MPPLRENPDLPIDKLLKVMPPGGSMDEIYTSRILNVLDVLVQLGRRIRGQTGECGFLPKACRQVDAVQDFITATGSSTRSLCPGCHDLRENASRSAVALRSAQFRGRKLRSHIV
jgi:hypothetical protein